MDVVIASGLPRSQLLIQSFIPANLDVAKRRLPRVPTSLLALTVSPERSRSPSAAATTGSRRSGPSPAASCAHAHRADLLVAPFTINTPSRARRAAAPASTP